MYYVLNDQGISSVKQQIKELMLPFYVEEFSKVIPEHLKVLSKDELFIETGEDNLELITMTIVSQLTLSGKEEMIELDLNKDFDFKEVYDE